ncbi:hypothetical protein PC116_g16830 [Phytophthora cactorum]|uniref:Uncharacterized protein n=1 Tax=Phytophthora cactorum TaxID=29920 RepID=A0A8T1E1C7_9STRA|nr:hypothetical protein Pcac1_g18968 [Phytophthora cactorum]KAG2818718.1 hypothetical protein PC112_g12485 [Phytophthora cactorum]KAG2820567.1 hypothetical protein PC111_g11401 [Phytophthora cactorum]KAG2901246.1 hypothetical protein PC114_g13244 [Phytophthora cactorum]KAG2947097.1 hypothetical protein PC117_g7100 [Phytophthora cactorum]
MAPTLRSGQLESSPVTLSASPQVMSPIRVHDSTTDTPGVEDPIPGGASANGSRGARQLADNVTDTATGRGDDVLSHEEAEHLIWSITGIQGGRSLVENSLEGLRARNLPVRNQPPPPNNPSDGGYSSGESSKAPSSRPSMLDNQNPGGRYDDKELAEHTKSLRNTADIKLPSLSKKEDYKVWFSEVPLHFESRLLGKITYGAERFDSVEGCQRPKYAEWYKARKVKAFSALALSLSVDLRTTFKIDSSETRWRHRHCFGSASRSILRRATVLTQITYAVNR